MAKQTTPTKTLGLVRVREDLGEKVFSLLEDPMKPGRIQYGSMRLYLEKLIARDLREREAISDELLNEILEMEL
jgi:hypothetical protein